MAEEGIFPKVDGDTLFASDLNRVDIRSATTTLDTTRSTTSSTYADSGDEVTISSLDSTKSYTFYATAMTQVNAGANGVHLRMVIGSTNTGEGGSAQSGTSQASCMGLISGQTGLTSITAKIQIRNDDNTTSVSMTHETGTPGRLIIFAYPE